MGRFLLVSLNMDAILGAVTIRQRRKKLDDDMTHGNGLGDAYTATLTRLKAQKGDKSALGLKVLMWVVYSERPLQTQELCHALGVEIGSVELDPENVPALRTLVASCLGLVTVEASSSTVRLVHITLKEHLSRNPTLFKSPHSTIAEVCLTYLNFGCIRDLSSTLRRAPAAAPLLKYASVYWGRHTRKGMTENIKILTQRLLLRFSKHISAQLLLLHYNGEGREAPYYFGAGPMGFTGLHGAAFFGIVEIVAALLELKECDVNARDCMGMTALIWASVRGHEEAVKMFLQREDLNPNEADTEYGKTALSWTAEQGHEGIVKMLLEREDVNSGRADTGYGRTPLLWAAKNGHSGVVKMLLEREDANPNQADTGYGKTPLLWAAKNGHSGVVKMLLEREDANPNQADTGYGKTPLLWAAEEGYERIVKMLLEREDADPSHADTGYGRTPLLWAAKNGHSGVVKMLLEREDVNPDHADTKCGRTPLSWAAGKGREGVVKILLEREDVNPDQTDAQWGRTPLVWAARRGRKKIVKMLSKQKNVRTAIPESMDQTPTVVSSLIDTMEF